MNDVNTTIPFNGNEFMNLVRGLESRKVPYQIEYRRVSESCDGIAVRIMSNLCAWEVGFFDNDHIEVLKFNLSGNVELGVTAASVLSALDTGDNPK